MVNQKHLPTLLTGTSHPLSATPEKRISYFPVSCEPPATPEGSQTLDTDNLLNNRKRDHIRKPAGKIVFFKHPLPFVSPLPLSLASTSPCPALLESWLKRGLGFPRLINSVERRK